MYIMIAKVYKSTVINTMQTIQELDKSLMEAEDTTQETWVVSSDTWLPVAGCRKAVYSILAKVGAAMLATSAGMYSLPSTVISTLFTSSKAWHMRYRAFSACFSSAVF